MSASLADRLLHISTIVLIVSYESKKTNSGEIGRLINYYTSPDLHPEGPSHKDVMRFSIEVLFNSTITMQKKRKKKTKEHLAYQDELL